MATSRKRFNTESDIGNSKRKTLKTRKFKRIVVVEEDIDDESSEDLNLGKGNENQPNNSTNNASQLIENSSESFSEEEDLKIINFFRKNMHLLKLKDNVSTFSNFQVKYSIKKSLKSIQSRLVNHILPNLFKYNILNDSDIIDFYDAAKLEVPEEFFNLVAEREGSKNKTTSNVSVQSNPQNDNDIASTSRGNQVETVPSTSEEKCLKSILNYIQLSNSNGTSVFVPDTERENIPSIETRLLNEFGIGKELVKMIPKERFDLIVQLKKTLDVYDELMYDVLKTRIHDTKFIEGMLPDAQKLFDYLAAFMETSKRPLQGISVSPQIIPHDDRLLIPELSGDNPNSLLNETWSEIEMTDNVGQIISTLSDSLDHISISSTSDNESIENDIKTERIEAEVEADDEADEEVRSPYFNPEDTVTSQNNSNLDSVEKTRASTSATVMDFESSLIEHACTPQIMFSKRSKDIILNKNLNVDYLLTNACDPNNSINNNNNNNNDNSSSTE